MTPEEREMLLEMPTVQELIRLAVTDEREACAREAESHADRNRYSKAPMTAAGVEIAAAIRARANP